MATFHKKYFCTKKKNSKQKKPFQTKELNPGRRVPQSVALPIGHRDD